MTELQAHPDADALLRVIDDLLRDAHRGRAPAAHLDSLIERDLGLDSLARVELIMRVERSLGIRLPENALGDAETPRDLLRLLRGARAASSDAGGRSAHDDTDVLSHGAGAGMPVRASTLIEALLWHVERQPERVSVLLLAGEREEALSYGRLYASALRYAGGLARAGLMPGQTVAIMLPTGAEYLYCFYGVLLSGGVPVPLYPPARLSQIEDHLKRHIGILRNARATLLVTVPEAKGIAYLLSAQVDSLRGVYMPSELDVPDHDHAPIVGRPADIAFLQYTSGSTGQPKGVVLTHDNLLANVRAMGRAVAAGPSDIFVSWLPLYHDMGLIGGCFATLYHGFPVVLMSPLAFLARPVSWLQAIHRHRGTISGGPNFAFELCLRRIPDEALEGIDLGSWRFAFNGAEPVVPDTLRAFEERFARWGLRRRVMSPVYGLAECSVGLAFTPPGEAWQSQVLDRRIFARDGTARPADADTPAEQRVEIVGCGRVIPEHEVRVVDAAGFELPDRNEGFLEFRGPSATSGYLRNPAATAALFNRDWLRTGDRAYLADGMLYITGREKDIIIRGGRNISPYELEEAVGDLEGVRRGCVAVFGSRDAASGTEKVVVLAETRETDAARMDVLRGQINERAIALIGAPADDIVLAPPQSVPKTSSGKIRRAASREFYERGAGAMRPAPVWMQLARLLWSAILPGMRRALRVAGAILFAARAWLAFALISPLALIASLLAPARHAWGLGHRMARLFFALAGIPVSAQGLSHLPEGPCVVVANHTSYLDAVALLALIDRRHFAFVAKNEFERNPLMRRLLGAFGTRFVERNETAESVAHAGRLLEAARTGTSLIVFAEGALRRQTGLAAFRGGAFQVAAQAGVPVIPAAIRGARMVLRDETWLPRRGSVHVHFSAPVTAAGTDWKAAVALRDQVRLEILGHCGEPDLTLAARNEQDNEKEPS